MAIAIITLSCTWLSQHNFRSQQILWGVSHDKPLLFSYYFNITGSKLLWLPRKQNFINVSAPVQNVLQISSKVACVYSWNSKWAEHIIWNFCGTFTVFQNFWLYHILINHSKGLRYEEATTCYHLLVPISTFPVQDLAANPCTGNVLSLPVASQARDNGFKSINRHAAMFPVDH